MENYLKKSGIVIFLAIFCNILWGSAFPFVKINILKWNYIVALFLVTLGIVSIQAKEN